MYNACEKSEGRAESVREREEIFIFISRDLWVQDAGPRTKLSCMHDMIIGRLSSFAALLFTIVIVLQTKGRRIEGSVDHDQLQ